MSEKLFQSKQDEIKIVSLFILTQLSKAPHEFSLLVENFRQNHGYEKDSYFARAMSNLFQGMLNEWWITVDDASKSSKVTITFKGQTVLRHTDEIDEFHARKFAKQKRVIQTVQPQPKSKVVAKTQISKSKPNKTVQKKAKKEISAQKNQNSQPTLLSLKMLLRSPTKACSHHSLRFKKNYLNSLMNDC